MDEIDLRFVFWWFSRKALYHFCLVVICLCEFFLFPSRFEAILFIGCQSRRPYKIPMFCCYLYGCSRFGMKALCGPKNNKLFLLNHYFACILSITKINVRIFSGFLKINNWRRLYCFMLPLYLATILAFLVYECV